MRMMVDSSGNNAEPSRVARRPLFPDPSRALRGLQRSLTASTGDVGHFTDGERRAANLVGLGAVVVRGTG